jgi:integrase
MASVKPRPGYGYEVRYIDPATGKRPSKTFKLKKDADAFRRKVERGIEDGTHIAAADAVTVRYAVEEFLGWCETREKDGRVGAAYVLMLDSQMRKHIIPRLGNIRLDQLTSKHVADAYAAMIEVPDVSPGYAKQVLQRLRTVEGFARRRGVLKTTPIADAMYELRGIKSEPIRTLTLDQAGVILRAALERTPGHSPRATAQLALMVHMAACCGLRAGEIRALDWDHVDLGRGEIRIRRSATHRNVLKGPKSAAGNRSVPLPSHLRAMLGEWKINHYRDNTLGLLFTGQTGAPLLHTSLHDQWSRLLIRTGIAPEGRGVHFHALRHFAASWWIENGLPLPEVATMLGHSKVDMTLSIYAHSLVRPHARHDAMEAMAGKLTALADASVMPSLTHQ